MSRVFNSLSSSIQCIDFRKIFDPSFSNYCFDYSKYLIMKNCINQAMSFFRSMAARLSIKQILSVVLVGFLVLTTSNAPNDRNQAATKRIDTIIQRNDSDRPKTTGEWQEEAEEIDNVGDRLQRIGKESAEAIKDWAGLYPDTAERSAEALDRD